MKFYFAFVFRQEKCRRRKRKSFYSFHMVTYGLIEAKLFVIFNFCLYKILDENEKKIGQVFMGFDGHNNCNDDYLWKVVKK